MVCFRVYNSPACCGTGITDGGDATAVNSLMPLPEIFQTDGHIHFTAQLTQLF